MSLTLLPFNEYPYGATINLHLQHPETQASKCFETLSCYASVLDCDQTFVSIYVDTLRIDHPRRDLCHHVLHIFGLAHIDRICSLSVQTILNASFSSKVRDACLSQLKFLQTCELRLVSRCTTNAAVGATLSGNPRCAVPALCPPLRASPSAAPHQEAKLRVIVSRPQSNPTPRTHRRPIQVKPRPSMMLPLQERQKLRARSSPLRNKARKRTLSLEAAAAAAQPSRFLVVPPAHSCSSQTQQPHEISPTKRLKTLARLPTPSPLWQHNASPQEKQRLQLQQQQHKLLAEQVFKQVPLTPSPLQLSNPASASVAAMPLQPHFGSPPTIHSLRRSAPRIESSLHRASVVPAAGPIHHPSGANLLRPPTMSPCMSPTRSITPSSQSPPRQEEAHRLATLPHQIGFSHSNPTAGRLQSHHSVLSGNSSSDACDTICLWNMDHPSSNPCSNNIQDRYDCLSTSPALERMSLQDFDERSQLWRTLTPNP